MTPAKILGLLLVIVYVVALRIFEGLDIRSVFEPPLLLPLLNTLFHGIIPIIVAYAAGKSYLKSGSVTVLFMGCGMLAFGLCAISAGWFIREPDGPNLTVTIHNTGVFLSSFFHAMGAILALFGSDYSVDLGRRKPIVFVSYSSIGLFMICFSFATFAGLIPPFFIQGVGPTYLRQAILASSILLYFISSIFFMTYYVKQKSDFLYWYALCLALICIGLFGIFIQRAVGSPMGWLARSALYVGSIFALSAVVSALKDARVRGRSLEQSIVDSFKNVRGSYGRRLIAALPIPIFLLLLVILASLNLKRIVEPPGLFAALNTVFLSILPLGVVYFATRGYLISGFFTMLMLGSGALTLGLGSLLSGWTLTLQGGGPNASTTIFNLSSLLSAIFHLFGGASVFVGGHPKQVTRHKGLIVAFAYIGIALLMATLTVVTLRDIVPTFFVQGQGPTPLRQVVLGSASVLFVISGLLLLSVHLLSKARILYWYSLALLLLATGLLCYMGNTLFGGPIGWLGRFSLYLAGIYLLVAVISGARDLRKTGESLETGIANLFRHHLESLVEERTRQLQTAHNELERANAELFQTNQRLRALMEALPVGVSFSNDVSCQRITGNPCLFAQFDIAPDDNLSASAPDPTAPGRLVRFFHNGRKIQGTELPLQRAVAENRVIPPIELEVQLPAGRSWFAEASGAPIRDDRGNVVGGVAVTVDITERKKAEEELERAHKTLAEAQKIAHMGSFEYVAATQTTVWSEEEYRIYGLDPAGPSPTYDLMLQNCIHPEDAASLHETFSQAMQSRSVYELEHRILLPDGSVRWVYDRAHPYFDEQGELARYVGTTLDITDRKMAEEALQQSEEKFRSIFDNSPLGVVHADAKGIVTACNDSFVRIVGTPLEKMIGLNSIRDLNDENLMAAVREALAGGKGHYEGQYTSRISNKTIHIKADIAPMFNQDGSVVGAIGIYEDIAARMQMERELRESEQRNRFLAHVIESSSQPFGVGRLDGSIVMANKAYGDLVGYTEEEMRHADWAKVLTPPQYTELESAKLADLIATRTPVRYEKEYIRKDGTRVPVELLVHTETNEAGEQFYYSFITDLTERKLAEQERETTVAFLQLVNETRGIGDLIREAAIFFQQRSGCDAVGIRLKEGDDYPYFEARGFPEDFILLENYLCDYDENNCVRRESTGAPILECMCGNVIRGRFDPAKPFFTHGGSFWTNSTTDLLASTTEEDRKARTRNRCNGEGYESVALIPLRGGDERWGLIQLNDKRKGRFTQETIALWERLAQYLDVALAKLRADEDLKEAKGHLEIRVQERTAELIDTNVKLQNEIVERKRAEERAISAAKEIEDLYNNAPCGYYSLDSNGVFLRINDTGLSWLGYTREEIIGKMTASDLCVPESLKIFEETYPGFMERGWIKDLEFHLVRKDGTILPVLLSATAVKDSSGNFVMSRSTMFDITDRKRAEEDLRESENRYRQMFQNSRAVKLLINPESYEIVDANQAASNYYGYKLDHLKQMKINDINVLSPEEIRQRISEAYTERENYFQFQHRLASGEVRYVEVYSTPMDLYGKRLLYSIVNDITDRRRAEEELIRSNEDLQQFAYVASHDLQEPLRNVASCLQMLEKKYKSNLDADADKYIQYAVESAVRMKALIQDLLEYSRVATKGKPPERVNCEQMLVQTVGNLTSAISEAGATITHDPLPIIPADGTQLLHVFQNLIQNAIKFRKDEPPRIHVSAAKNKNEWIFSVKDNGIGIESRHLDRIFVIFQRLHKRSQYDGTGMGLAIVKKVVERHGGRVWVQSEPGAGTTFHFTIPEKGSHR